MTKASALVIIGFGCIFITHICMHNVKSCSKICFIRLRLTKTKSASCEKVESGCMRPLKKQFRNSKIRFMEICKAVANISNSYTAQHSFPYTIQYAPHFSRSHSRSELISIPLPLKISYPIKINIQPTVYNFWMDNTFH